ncbi:MAG TPA: hypothetical protein P5514_11070 [Bacteroidales bacterium]|nr:hypothetical protein [Bacteroidales bacterium]HPE56140.1 hypothetical protein [Bacteroidales bacterium]HRX97478.1 hypothetical protein [Bacteroidales bacterium]
MKEQNKITCNIYIQKIGFLVAVSLLMLLTKQAASQNDTSAQLPDSILQYITPMEYAFMMHEDTKWLVKLYFEDHSDPYFFGSTINLGAELKLTNTLSLNTYVSQYASFEESELKISEYLNTYFEGRWYYRIKEKIKNDKPANSLSDNYLALGMQYRFHTFERDLGSSDYTYITENTLYLKWGLQRRFIKYGLADFGLKAGLTNIFQSDQKIRFTFNTFVYLGLGLTKDQYQLDKNKLCPVIRCYENLNLLYKSNLSQLVFAANSGENIAVYIQPHLAVEYKFGNTPFSINAELNSRFSFYRYIQTKTHLNDDTIYNTSKVRNTSDGIIGFTIETRYYYNLKSRILKGKCGNSLSADYIAIGTGDSWYIYNPDIQHSPAYDRPFIFIKAGWQRLISEHIYYDIHIGLKYFLENREYFERLTHQFGINLGYRI